MTQNVSRDQLRDEIKRKKVHAVAVHESIASALQPYVLEARKVVTPIETALAFLCLQAYEAHDAVGVLAENVLAEGRWGGCSAPSGEWCPGCLDRC